MSSYNVLQVRSRYQIIMGVPWVYYVEETGRAKQAVKRRKPMSYVGLRGSMSMLACITSSGWLQYTCWEVGSEDDIGVLRGTRLCEQPKRPRILIRTSSLRNEYTDCI